MYGNIHQNRSTEERKSDRQILKCFGNFHPIGEPMGLRILIERIRRRNEKKLPIPFLKKRRKKEMSKQVPLKISNFNIKFLKNLMIFQKFAKLLVAYSRNFSRNIQNDNLFSSSFLRQNLINFQRDVSRGILPLSTRGEGIMP